MESLLRTVYSRKFVGWRVYAQGSSVLVSDVLRDLCARESIQPDQLILGPMKGATMLATLQERGVMPSLSHPGVRNDKPYSESLFKTLKYRPAYPLKAFDNCLPRAPGGGHTSAPVQP
ncbi:hypothetical protein [Paraburkholderia sp. RL18-085-BIA-A]|uniref:hypothetical protein n=1 Tax=Paraburkholderia sp. RL18-085-BIA-A TaxID=3031633 RepID=UPI0038BBA4A5